MNAKKSLKIAAIAIAITATSALAAEEIKAPQAAPKRDPTTVLATIGNEKITQADVDATLAMLDPRERAAYSTPQGQEEVLNSIIDLKIFSRSARERKLQNDEKFKRLMAKFEERLLFTMAQESIANEAAKPAPTDDDARKFYDEHKEIFQVPAGIRASHILIRADKNMTEKERKEAAKRAAEILSEIGDKKITFEDAAKNYSADPGTRPHGGDLGFFTRGQMVAPFEKAAFALKKGEMTKKPVKTDFGYHIIKVTDTREARIRTFDETKEDIKNDLTYQKQIHAIADARDQLRKKYDVKLTASAAQSTNK